LPFAPDADMAFNLLNLGVRMAFEVRLLSTESDCALWDRFALSHPHGSAFHLTAWKQCIESAFGYTPQYMMAFDQGTLRAVLPLFLVENYVLKRALISSPFAVYGGILADSPDASGALAREVHRLGAELGVQYIELRNGHAEQVSAQPNVDRYATFTKAVTPDEAALMDSLPKKTRNMVRKALKTPFAMRIGSRDIAQFERIHSTTMRRLGTPCFPKQHFANILKYFGPMVDIREVVYQDRIVAASLNFFFRDQMHTYYAGADQDFNAVAPNTFMYYDHLRWAGQNGLKTFEFGRSKKGTGPFEFKRHWGTDMHELPYEILLVRKKEVPNYTPANKNFGLAIQVWRNLPPVVARTLGPRLIRLFP
jgi:FemAB-related protein (PEP-CTERM system-associated)